jgi:hypothetical protein
VLISGDRSLRAQAVHAPRYTPKPAGADAVVRVV